MKTLATSGKTKASTTIGKIAPYFGLIAVFVLFATTTNGKFASYHNLKTILLQSIIVMIAGVGASFVMAHGNLDFSIGGEMAIGAIVALLVGQNISPWLSLPAAMIACALCGLFSAWANGVVKIPAFIAGISVMFIGRGLALGLSYGMNMKTPKALVAFDKPYVYIIVLVVVFIVGYILMEHTKIGRYNKAIGANEDGAHLSGIAVFKYKAYAFMISGACMGICAMLSLIQGRSMTANTGLNVEINTLIVLILGGFSLAGGTNVSLRSVIVGGLTFYMLYNGLILWGLTPDAIVIVKAVVFLACVYLSSDRKSGVVPA